MKILADASLPNLSDRFKAPFVLTHYTSDSEVRAMLPMQDILLCRSTLKVTDSLLTNSQIQCVATASSGVDHIDTSYLKQHHIALFDAKGCNAIAVTDYVMASIAYLSQHHLIIGHKAGVIGLGEVGRQVVARLKTIGFDVIAYDPLKQNTSDDGPFCSLSDLTHCDVLCVHANFHTTEPYPSANLIDHDFLTQLKPGTVIINAARGGIVNEQALLQCTTPITYCTDVYQEEPNINPEIVKFSTLCTPHIAGHSIEAKDTAIIKVSQALHDYFKLPLSPIMTPINLLEPIPLTKDNWVNQVLSLYNPLSETTLLKSAQNKAKSFLTQRKAHQNRHNFSLNHLTNLTK